MKQFRFVKFCILILFVICNKSYGQISSLFRFSNVVYYKIHDLSEEKLRGTSLSFFDKTLLNRYFDTYLKTDSLKVIFGDTCFYFRQKKRAEPKEYKEIVFYRIRCLKNDSITIKSIKLVDIDSIYIKGETVLYYKSSGKLLKKKQILLFPINEIEGVFLGPGRKTRHSMIIGEIVAGILAIILVAK